MDRRLRSGRLRDATPPVYRCAWATFLAENEGPRVDLVACGKMPLRVQGKLGCCQEEFLCRRCPRLSTGASRCRVPKGSNFAQKLSRKGPKWYPKWTPRRGEKVSNPLFPMCFRDSGLPQRGAFLETLCRASPQFLTLAY